MPSLLKVVSIDDVKEAIPGYDPKNADEFHSLSARIANRLFEDELKERKDKDIILLCGGSASGKTEFLAQFLSEDFDGLVFDSTFSTELGAKIKIKKILASGNKPKLYLVLPKNLPLAFTAFCNRERKIPEYRFFETHAGARQVALWVAKNFPEIEILVYENQLERSSEEDFLPFSEIEVSDRNSLVRFLENIQMSEEEIFAKIRAA